MSNKQSLSFEKCIHFIFHHSKYFFTFSSQVLFWGLGYSVLIRSMLCLIDKSSQFCDTRYKYEVAITCAFVYRLRILTISAVLTCTTNMPACATLGKYRILRYLICFFTKKKCSQQCLLVRLECPFKPCEMLWNHFSTRGLHSLARYKRVLTYPF